MNKQRKVLITITYNEMGIIIDTKAEEVAQPNLQPTCNQLATDCISRQAAIDAMCELMHHWFGGDPKDEIREIKRELGGLPPAQPTLYGYKIEHLAYIASVMKKEGVTAEYAVRTFDDIGRAIKMIIDETRDITRDIVERSIFNGLNQQTGGD